MLLCAGLSQTQTPPKKLNIIISADLCSAVVDTCFTLTEKIDFIRKSSELLSSVVSLADIITFRLLYTYWLQVFVLPVGLVAWFLDSGGYYGFFAKTIKIIIRYLEKNVLYIRTAYKGGANRRQLWQSCEQRLQN